MDRVFSATGRNAFIFALAFGMKKAGYFTQEDGARAIGLVVKFMVPFVMARSIPGITLDLQWLSLALLCLVYGAVNFLLIWLVSACLFPELGRRDRGQCILLSIGHAVALVGLPVMDGYYSRPGLVRAAVFDTLNCFFAYMGTFACASYFAVDEPPVEKKEEKEPHAEDKPPEEEDLATVIVVEPPLAGEAEMQAPQRPRPQKLRSGSGFSHELSGQSSQWSGLIRPSRKAISVVDSIREPSTPCRVGASAEIDEESLAASRGVLLCKLLRNIATQPPVIGMGAGVALKAAGIRVEQLPTFLSMALVDSGSAAGPVTFFVLGLFFSPSVLQNRRYAWRALKLLGIRYSLAISTALALWQLWKPSGDDLLPRIGGLCVLMPVPPVCIAFSMEMGYDAEFAALIVNATLICSFVLAFSYAALVGM